MNNNLLMDNFSVKSVDMSKFERVGRVKAKSSGFDVELTLDVNIELFALSEKDNIHVCITKNPVQSSMGEEESFDSIEKSFQKVMNQFDYVMYGKVFHISDSNDKKSVSASFGGLLMLLVAEKEVLRDFELDQRIYIMCRSRADFDMMN